MRNKKGIALMIIMAFSLMLVILAGTILAILTSSGRLNEHQLRRTLAYYAANAGVQYTLECLRMATTVDLGRGACDCCADPTRTCTVSFVIPQNGQDYTVHVRIGTVFGGGFGELAGTRGLTATVDYTI